MALNREEAEDLAWLLGKYRATNYLTPVEERRLRELMAKENPATREMTLGEVVAAGLFVVGLLAILGILAKSQS